MEPRRCPGCNLPLPPVTFIAATATRFEAAGVIGLCRRCNASLHRLPPPTSRKRLFLLVDKALARPDRFFAAVFETPDQAHIAAALAQADPIRGLDMLGWTSP